MDGVPDNCLCHLLTRLDCRGHKGTFIFTYLGPTYELSIVKIADAVVNRNLLWGQKCLFQLSLPISSTNMNKKLQPVRDTFSRNSQCNKSSSCIGRAIFFFIFVLKIGRSSYKKKPVSRGMTSLVSTLAMWKATSSGWANQAPQTFLSSPFVWGAYKEIWCDVWTLYEVHNKSNKLKEMRCIRNFDKRPLDKLISGSIRLELTQFKWSSPQWWTAKATATKMRLNTNYKTGSS